VAQSLAVCYAKAHTILEDDNLAGYYDTDG